MPEQIQSIISNLRGFGVKRLAMLAGIAVLVMSVIGVASVYLNRPAYDTLYVGLDRADVNQIGLVLGEAGIGFDVGADGTSVLVPAGTTAQARMLLAEKGLPTSANAGYELFDNVGSLGLTSFMQQITRVRALEGEIARTIQSIAGIKAARVHIVMSERANFRRDEQQPSASVVIRYSGIDAEKSAMSIRHLVAAAVPGLSADKVTVLDSNGNLLAAGDDPSNTSAARTLGVEQTVEAQVGDLRGEINEAEESWAALQRDSGEGAGDDQADAGTKTFEREHEMSLAANSRDLLSQVERALQRLDDNTYPVCESCGNPIGKARLQAFPRATLCVSCKQREERR